MKTAELDALLGRDFDDVVEGARSLSGRSRSLALHAALTALQAHSDPATRVKLLLFIQTILASMPEGKLTAAVAAPLANELVGILLAPSEPDTVKRSALDGIALLRLKASGLSAAADGRLREGIAVATNFSDPEMSSFARRILPEMQETA